jgi:hypothetical protein
MNEKPRGFAGFRVSAAAFLIDGIQNNRTPPDWFYVHEKRQQKEQWERERAASPEDDRKLRREYEQQRAAALQDYLASAEGRRNYQRTYQTLLTLYKLTDPHRYHEATHEATVARIERYDFKFPEYAVWALTSPHTTRRHAA